MYDDDFKFSSRHINATRAFTEAVINDYEESTVAPKQPRYKMPYQDESEVVMESVMKKYDTSVRYHSFSETLRNSLVVEALYNIYKNSVDPLILTENANTSIMRAIVNEYVQETGYDTILDRMRTASVYMSDLYRTITESTKKMLEVVDKSDPDTFRVTPEMKDEFFAKLNYNDSEAITDAIHSRVSDAMSDFVNSNARDHEDITTALQHAQDQIDNVQDDNKELKEYYEMKGKRAVNEILMQPKNAFHNMVKSMCESVMKHSDSHAEFMTEGHLDMPKIVDRVSLMYTFMEMLNTTRLDKIDKTFVENVISDLKK